MAEDATSPLRAHWPASLRGLFGLFNALYFSFERRESGRWQHANVMAFRKYFPTQCGPVVLFMVRAKFVCGTMLYKANFQEGTS
jgi:hypothetical protein